MTTTPSFVLSARTRASDLRALALPLTLAETAPETWAAHEQLARRLGEATARVIAAKQRLEEAVAADDDAAENAIRQGEPLPKATKSERARNAVDEAERELVLVSELVPTSARELLHAVAPHAADVAVRMSEQADELKVQVLGRLVEARELLAAADTARREAAFAARVAEGGEVRPFIPGSTSAGPSSVAVDAARAAIEQEAARREERRRAFEHERVALNTFAGRELSPPPTRDELQNERASLPAA